MLFSSYSGSDAVYPCIGLMIVVFVLGGVVAVLLT